MFVKKRKWRQIQWNPSLSHLVLIETGTLLTALLKSISCQQVQPNTVTGLRVALTRWDRIQQFKIILSAACIDTVTLWLMSMVTTWASETFPPKIGNRFFLPFTYLWSSQAVYFPYFQVISVAVYTIKTLFFIVSQILIDVHKRRPLSNFK